MKFLSLFSGIGGIDLGLERAGMTCVGQVEIDAFCRAVLAKHWPEVKRLEDIRNVKGNEFGDIDCIAGGFPCQDISNAGKRAGIEGERSGLWAEFFRLICVVQPRIVIVENVAALLARGMGRVLGDLASIGFDAEWTLLPASAFGAWHYRCRIFIVGFRPNPNATGEYDSRGKIQIQHELSAFSGGPSSPRLTGCAGCSDDAEKIPHAYGERCRYERLRHAAIPVFGCSAPRKQNGQGMWWSTDAGMDRVAHGLPGRVDRLRGLGNAVVPQVAEWIGHRIMESPRAGDILAEVAAIRAEVEKQ